jgi:hypothetical protein
MVIDACAELAKQYIQGNKNKILVALSASPAKKSGWFNPSPKIVAQLQSQPSTQSASAGNVENTNQRILVVVGTYTIGKERVLKGLYIYISFIYGIAHFITQPLQMRYLRKYIAIHESMRCSCAKLTPLCMQCLPKIQRTHRSMFCPLDRSTSKN